MTGVAKDKRLFETPWVISALLLAVSFLAYANTYGHPWMLDDIPVIVNNPDVASWQGFLQNSYPGRPMRELSFLLDHALFGFESAGWHIQSNLWHAVNGILLFYLIRRFTGATLPAIISALLFILHPVQVEVVGNISHRKDLLATAFSLVSIHTYMTGCLRSGSGRLPWIALSLGLGALAFLSKQTAIALPLIWCAYEYLYLTKEERILLRFPPLIMAGAAVTMTSLLVWFVSFGGLAAYRKAYLVLLVKVNRIPPFTDQDYLLSVFKSWAFLFRRVVWPVDLAPEYLVEAPSGWLDPMVLSGVMVFGCLVGVFLITLRWREVRCVTFGLIWFLAFFLVTANLIWPLAYFAADRYLYTPMAGVAAVSGWLCWKVMGEARRWFVVVPVAVCLLFIVMTWQQIDLWSSPEKLWDHAVKVSPNSYPALSNLAKAYDDQGQHALAVEYYERSAKVNSSAPEPRYNLGVLYDKQGDRFRALYYFREYLARADISSKGFEHELAKTVRAYVFKKYGVKL